MAGPNVALVVLDTLRKDAFDEWFDWLPGCRFERAWAPSHWTVPVHASLFAGRYPSELGVHAKAQQFDCPEPALPELLRDAGYRTRAFSNNLNVSPRTGFDRGFDEFTGGWRFDAVEREEELFAWGEFVTEIDDETPFRYLKALRACVAADAPTLPSLRRGALLKLRELGRGPHADDGARETRSYVSGSAVADSGEFLFVNLMEAHAPYTPPRRYRTGEGCRVHGLKATAGGLDADPDAVRGAYEDCVRYLADVYRDIFRELRADFDYVVTLADHGELLGEATTSSTGPDGGWGHLFGLAPELVHVPLSIAGPDVPDGPVETPVSLLDVHRTILDLADVAAASRGASLLDPPGGRDHLTEYHGLNPLQYRSLANAGMGDAADRMDRELHGIVVDEFYGYESLDGWVDAGAPPEDPKERLAAVRETLDVREVETEENADLDGDLEAQLRALGYV